MCSNDHSKDNQGRKAEGEHLAPIPSSGETMAGFHIEENTHLLGLYNMSDSTRRLREKGVFP